MNDHFKVLGLIYEDLESMYDRAVQAGIQDDKLLRALIHAEDTARDLQIRLCNDRVRKSKNSNLFDTVFLGGAR
ncbi:MAG: hypothetical protein CMJ25_14630 [Phycisphaerae bacterium]|nr:hypothetical protein [Phycisphaerae bacterium]|tara:strand:+ start:2134 stop:2355 length:222 start_codon:yes stop_codon:yes gene_type:complete